MVAKAGGVRARGKTMAEDAKRAQETSEKRCPKCGSEAFAWVSSDNGTDTFECRKCKALFAYDGDW
jgi:hypothetical protein